MGFVALQKSGKDAGAGPRRKRRSRNEGDGRQGLEGRESLEGRDGRAGRERKNPQKEASAGKVSARKWSLKDVLNNKKPASDHPPTIDHLPIIDRRAALARALKPVGNDEEHIEIARQKDADIRTALTAIETTLYEIDKIREIMEQAYEVVLSTRTVEDASARALLAESYDDLRVSIDNVIANVSPEAVDLIGATPAPIEVPLAGQANYAISPVCLNTSEHGLNLSPPADAFFNFEEIDRIIRELDIAGRFIDRVVSGYCRDAHYLMGRLSNKDEPVSARLGEKMAAQGRQIDSPL